LDKYVHTGKIEIYFYIVWIIRGCAEVEMVLYHGSLIGGIDVLKPSVSEHGEPFVYFSSNPAVAAFYTVRAVEKPFSWYPYGFNGKGVPEYVEYYPDALMDIYGGKQGYLYVCKDVPDTANPTHIRCAYASRNPVAADDCIALDDVYMYFMESEKRGELAVRKFESLNEKELAFANNYLRKLIVENDLKHKPDSKLALLVKSRFPKVWEEAL
jgi:hypothetical protein